MKKMTRGVGAIVAGLAMLTLSAVAAPAAEQPGFETYVVRHGDTLSGIAGRVFGDVTRWREILKVNPQVTNANRIYPGDTLQLPIREIAVSAGGDLAAREGAAGAGGTAMADAAAAEQRALEAAAAAAGAAGSGGAAAGEAGSGAQEESAGAGAVPELPVVQVRAIPIVNPSLSRAAGYIADALPAIGIVATEDDRIIVATGDAAIINAPVVPGSRFTVVRADRRIFHPVTGVSLGWLTRVLGAAEVTCRGEENSTVVLLGMRDSAGVGDYLVPSVPGDAPEAIALAGKEDPACVPAGAADGVIVAFDEDRLAIGEQEFAYIDRGSATGVAAGSRFTIYREIAHGGRAAVGELQVLRAGESTSTALVTNSLQEVQVGDLLRAR